MSTDNTPYYEIIDFAANEKPVEFVNKFNQIMFKKAYDAVEKYKQDIANNYFCKEPEEKEEEISDENA
jgi:hypothetical protein